MQETEVACGPRLMTRGLRPTVYIEVFPCSIASFPAFFTIHYSLSTTLHFPPATLSHRRVQSTTTLLRYLFPILRNLLVPPKNSLEIQPKSPSAASIMRFSVSTTVLSLCAVFATATPVPEPIPGPGPNPNQVYIENVTYAGTGCPINSATVTILNGGTDIAIDFDDHFCIPPPLTKNCNINFKVHYPSGYSFALFQTEYLGHIKLNPKCQATLDSRYWFAGFLPPKSYHYAWAGPISQNFDITDSIAQGEWVWSPCGAYTTLNVNTRISLSANGCGSICIDEIKERVRTLFRIQWKTCR